MTRTYILYKVILETKCVLILPFFQVQDAFIAKGYDPGRRRVGKWMELPTADPEVKGMVSSTYKSLCFLQVFESSLSQSFLQVISS